MGQIRGLDRAAVRGLVVVTCSSDSDFSSTPTYPIDSLSKGNKQKVVIAEAFLAPVGLVVLDEPHSGLDAQARRTLDELIESGKVDEGRGQYSTTSHTVPIG